MQRVVVVSSAQHDEAHAAVAEGACVVVVGDDAPEVGALVRDLVGAGGRAGAFVGEPGEQLNEMIAELFPEFAVSDLHPHE